MHIIGIDPGLVDTGVVSMLFDTKTRSITVTPLVVTGVEQIDNLDYLSAWVLARRADEVLIEKYAPRPGMGTNARMVELEHMLKDVLHRPLLVRNTGSKQVITRELMELLGVWKFTPATHHQDLRSAARIALYGAVKDAEMNIIIADVVGGSLGVQPWTINARPGESYGA